MIKIDINMPEKCGDCRLCQIAFDSDLFNDGEPYCCIEGNSVEENVGKDTKPEWCPLIECNDDLTEV